MVVNTPIQEDAIQHSVSLHTNVLSVLPLYYNTMHLIVCRFVQYIIPSNVLVYVCRLDKMKCWFFLHSICYVVLCVYLLCLLMVSIFSVAKYTQCKLMCLYSRIVSSITLHNINLD